MTVSIFLSFRDETYPRIPPPGPPPKKVQILTENQVMDAAMPSLPFENVGLGTYACKIKKVRPLDIKIKTLLPAAF